jgi:predicted nuclease of predicted toxin-antitoxin system
MQIKLDENLPTGVADLLRERGYDVDTVRTQGLTGRPDEEVWHAAHMFKEPTDWHTRKPILQHDV